MKESEELRVKSEELRKSATLNSKLSTHNSLDKAVRAQGGAVVKPHQVKAMILAARRAYVKIKNEELRVKSEDLSTSTTLNSQLSTLPSFDAWRRATLHDVVGAAAPSSFRAVTQRDYVAVMDYFLRLAGEESEELRVKSEELRASTTLNSQLSTLKSSDERRRAMWALNLEEGRLSEEFGGREGARRYADALFGKIHRTDRLTATARQVWAVIFTLRNRAAKRRTRTALGALGASDVPSSPPDGSERFPAFSRAFPAIP